MTCNRMFPLTLKPTKKNNTTPFVDKRKSAQLEIALTIESARNTNEENNVCSIKKGENGADVMEKFQYEIQDDSWLFNFRFGNLNFGGLKLVHTKNMEKGFPLLKNQKGYVKAAYLERNTENHFQLESLTEKNIHWK
jgi:hypothetical protein